jgi:DNA-directed RNA polymerase subunit alpha
MLVIQRPTVEPVTESDGNRQKFSISPLEPGFGHTLGNSLRRTLLSSIPGAAITQVRFDDALHEFDTITGITEDVTDILLNLKDVVVVSHSDEPVEVRLDVRGAADVTGADLETNPDIEILNKDLHIATLNSKARLALDLTIEKGRGYRSGDRDAEETTIGIIPLDAIYSPVRRVTFEVEATRVEQETAYDALILDIETDGSISPREAGPQAAGSPDLDLPIEDLDLSERPRNCLKRAQVNTVGELLEKSEDDLLAITNFGQKSLDEVIAKLDERGLTLKGGPATITPQPE